MGDWIQGPYLYALYRSYGWDVGAIGELFVFGFLSSATLGTAVGSLADKFEHFSRGFDDKELGVTFAMATFANGIVAISSGIIANAAVDVYGLVAPFMIAICFFVLGLFVVMLTWNENYGTQSEDANESSFASLANAFHIVRNSYVMFATGMTQSLFEAGLYIFVFMWPPALEAVASAGVTVPYGNIFAAFMVSTMLGSIVFRYLTSAKWTPERILMLSLILAGISFTSFILFQHNQLMLYLSFNLYEITLGIYFPVMGIVRSQYIPEH
ncbi:UNVERIFIED_CONTAM: Molybdate-anion transporter, partial [Siphonaria sp. JEL0065]